MRECVYRIQSKSSKVLQLRIDFDIEFQAPSLPFDSPLSPITVPTCDIDVFSVGKFRFCGSDKNQHSVFMHIQSVREATPRYNFVFFFCVQVYLPFNATTTRIAVLRIRLGDRTRRPDLSPATWRIKVTQIEVPYGAARSLAAPTVYRSIGNDSLPAGGVDTRTWNNIDNWLRAPNGCDQYFPNTKGAFESFNYNGGSGPYPPNLNYFICFRRQDKHTKIT